MKYTIKKNRHRSKPRKPRLWFGRKSRRYLITFSKECWYDPTNSYIIPGVNKLFGFAFCLHGEKTFGKIPIIKNLVNSILIGWKPSYIKDKFILYEYKDVRGIETREMIVINISADVPFIVDYYIRKRHYVVIISQNSKKLYQIEGIKPNILFGYYLRPYFGGQSKAPNAMSIEITKI